MKFLLVLCWVGIVSSVRGEGTGLQASKRAFENITYTEISDAEFARHHFKCYARAVLGFYEHQTNSDRKKLSADEKASILDQAMVSCHAYREHFLTWFDEAYAESMSESVIYFINHSAPVYEDAVGKDELLSLFNQMQNLEYNLYREVIKLNKDKLAKAASDEKVKNAVLSTKLSKRDRLEAISGTASLSGKAIKQSKHPYFVSGSNFKLSHYSSSYKYAYVSWKCTINNKTNQPANYDIKFKFLDKNKYLLEYDFHSNSRATSRGLVTVTGQAMVERGVWERMKNHEVEVTVR